MPSFIAKRIILLVPTLVLVTIIVFILLRVVPPDPAKMICLPCDPDDPDVLMKLRAFLGTDRHIIIQYGDWFINMWRLDFRISYFYGEPVWDYIKAALPFTLELAILAMLMATVVAVPLGMASAITRGARMYHAARVIATMWASLPNFCAAILLIFLLVKGFNWLSPFGLRTLVERPRDQLKGAGAPCVGPELCRRGTYWKGGPLDDDGGIGGRLYPQDGRQ